MKDACNPIRTGVIAPAAVGLELGITGSGQERAASGRASVIDEFCASAEWARRAELAARVMSGELDDVRLYVRRAAPS